MQVLVLKACEGLIGLLDRASPSTVFDKPLPRLMEVSAMIDKKHTATPWSLRCRSLLAAISIYV